MRGILDARPSLAQIANIVGQFGFAGIFSVGAKNKATAATSFLGADQRLQTSAQCIALVLRNFLRDTNMVVLRQKHQQAPCDADLGGQARAFGADGVFDDLHHDGLALEDLLLDGHLRLVFAGKHWRFAIFLALPDIGHMQESRTLQPDIDKGRLHAGQHTRDFAQVDVADQTALQRPLHMQLLHSAMLDNRHPRLLRGPVDQNILLH